VGQCNFIFANDTCQICMIYGNEKLKTSFEKK